MKNLYFLIYNPCFTFFVFLCKTLSFASQFSHTVRKCVLFKYIFLVCKSRLYLLAHEEAGLGVELVVVVVVVVTVVVVVGGRVVVMVVVVIVVVGVMVVVFSPPLSPPSESGFLSSEQKWSQVDSFCEGGG